MFKSGTDTMHNSAYEMCDLEVNIIKNSTEQSPLK